MIQNSQGKVKGYFQKWETLPDVKHRKSEIKNRLTWVYAVGCSICHLIGSGVWGFMTAQSCMRFWFVIVFSFGLAFLVGQWTMVLHLFTIPCKVKGVMI